MTINLKFEAYKIKRETKRSGKRYEFFRDEIDEFGEQTQTNSPIGTIDGIYFEVNNHIRLSSDGISRTRASENTTGKIPSILCLIEDVENSGIRIGDFLKINEKKFTVNGVRNVQEWDIISIISLKVVDDGVKIQL